LNNLYTVLMHDANVFFFSLVEVTMT
jgi:hypothetical protein